MDELDTLLEAMRGVQRNDLVDAFRRIHERKTRATSPQPPAVSRFLEMIRPAKAQRPETDESAYDEARRGMIEYERMIRGYSERVGRFIDAVRRQDHLESRRSAVLPQVILRIAGPVEGRSGARFAVRSERGEGAELSLKPRWFKTRDGSHEAMPRVELDPPGAVVAPGERVVVAIHLDFAGTGFPAEKIIDGEVAAEIAGEQVMLIGIEAELHGEATGGSDP